MSPSVWQLRQQEAERVIRRAVVAVGVACGVQGEGTHAPSSVLYLKIRFFFSYRV
jgi:hypothetical protein